MSIADLCRACGVMGIGLGLLAAPAWAHWEKDSAHYTASEISSRQDAGLLASVPVGTVIMWPGTEAPGPAGHWLKLDGSTFDAAKYPDLARILGGNRLPDGRGVFMVGVQPGEQLGERLAADAGEHNHLLATKTVTSPKPAAAPLPPPPAVTTPNEPSVPDMPNPDDPDDSPDERPDQPSQPDMGKGRCVAFAVGFYTGTVYAGDYTPFICINRKPIFIAHDRWAYSDVDAFFQAHADFCTEISPSSEPKTINGYERLPYCSFVSDTMSWDCLTREEMKEIARPVAKQTCASEGPTGLDISSIAHVGTQ